MPPAPCRLTREAQQVLTAQDVAEEAARRMKAIGYDRWRSRELLTGIAVPRDVRYLALQIGYVADAIVRLGNIPADFRSDIYWPA